MDQVGRELGATNLRMEEGGVTNELLSELPCLNGRLLLALSVVAALPLSTFFLPAN